VLERGEVANSWRRERWDSLRLLTPNWQSRLPGLRYEGQDPDGYMTAGEVTEFIERFAAVSRAPVRTGENVTSVRRDGDGYLVTATGGEIACRAVVIASGACNRPSVPSFSGEVPASVEQFTPFEDLTRARRLPSPQLVGTRERATLDLNVLTAMGVELVGRWAMVRDGRALFSGGLRNMFSLADLKLRRLLDAFDEWALTSGRDAEFSPPERLEPTRVPESSRLQLDLGSGEIRSIVWTTGFRPEYGWLDVPVVDAKGHLEHEGGVVGTPGLYALGLPVLRRRRSTFICGIEDDAREVTDHLAGYLAGR
jgi:hypothetical protein